MVGMEEQFTQFMQAAAQYARLKEIRNAGTAIALLIETALAEIEKLELEEESEVENAGRTEA